MMEGESKRKQQGKLESYVYAKKINNDNLPLADRKFENPEMDFYRPAMIEFFLCKKVKIENVKITNSPFWVVHPVFSQHLTFRNIFFDCQVVNNDGIDPESSSMVLIENIIFNNHDDNIAIKAGRDLEGMQGINVKGLITDTLNLGYIKNDVLKGGSENIVIRNNVFKGHHAICVGSEMSGGVKNVYAFDNIAPQDVYMAVFLKSSRKRGGNIENFYLDNFQVNQAKADAISIIPNYDDDNVSKYPPSFKNIYIRNVTVNSAGNGIRVWGWPDAITKNVHLEKITIKNVEEKNLEFNHVENLTFENVNVEGELYKGSKEKSDSNFTPPKQD